MAVAACDGDSVAGFAGPSLEIIVSITGAEPDLDGYTVQVDAERARAVRTATPLQVHNIQPGDHTVFVAGIADNCMVDGANPRSVMVEIEGTPRSRFQWSAPPGPGRSWLPPRPEDGCRTLLHPLS